ncbi:hypothetical protein ACLMAL_32250 [Nocardia sp. CWNU-33]|uniref:hypothetical protein n=1 Tax=Nocardia sp. CWNU-33 TaxID=3392117 RepID=UPI00398E68F1
MTAPPRDRASHVDDSADTTATSTASAPEPTAIRRPWTRLWWGLIRRSGPGSRPLRQWLDYAYDTVTIQDDPLLYRAMTEDEIAAEYRLHVRLRRQKRRQRARIAALEGADVYRDHKQAAKDRRAVASERRWHERALAARRRETSPDTQVGMLYRRTTGMSTRLRVAIVGALLWSAINVGMNFAPDHADPTGPVLVLWILSFGLEALISIPILEIMAQATIAARLGRLVDRSRIVLFEAALLLATVSLNAGPHLAAANFGRAAQYSVAPTMVVVLMWLHAWLAARYAKMIDEVSATSAAHDTDDSPSEIAELPQAAPVPAPSPITLVPAYGSTVFPSTASPTSGATVAEVTSPPTSEAVQAATAAAGISENDADIIVHIARHMRSRRQTPMPEQHLISVLEKAARGLAHQFIANEMAEETGERFHASTIGRIVYRAQSLGLPINQQQEVRTPIRTA